MSVTRKPYGTMPTGEAVEQLTITGKGGLSVSFITYGGTLTNLVFDGKDIVLGYESMEAYLNEVGSIGVTVGRYANRIDGGTFELNGVTYNVGCNEKGYNHLHGGKGGFQIKNWTVAAVEEDAIILRQFSPDGEVGYPGNVTVDVHISVKPDNTLSFEYTATTDKDTVINLTNHAYFNLNGYDSGMDVLDTLLQIPADTILPVNERLIPLGERMPVDGTPFDFRELKPIGRDIKADHEQIKRGGGFDHNFILGETAEWRLAAVAVCENTGIRMECYTDQPGVQLYTGNYLNTENGKGGPMFQYQGFCLETQHFPDSPHHPDFPSTVLKAGEAFHSVTEYRFSTI